MMHMYRHLTMLGKRYNIRITLDLNRRYMCMVVILYLCGESGRFNNIYLTDTFVNIFLNTFVKKKRDFIQVSRGKTSNMLLENFILHFTLYFLSTFSQKYYCHMNPFAMIVHSHPHKSNESSLATKISFLLYA